jgi:hypothetical protein
MWLANFYACDLTASPVPLLLFEAQFDHWVLPQELIFRTAPLLSFYYICPTTLPEKHTLCDHPMYEHYALDGSFEMDHRLRERREDRFEDGGAVEIY